MNATDANTALEILEDLHLEEDPGCEYPCCDRPIAWTGTMKCCGKTHDLCGYHHDQQTRRDRDILGRGNPVRCKGCGRKWDDPTTCITWIRRSS